jgi:hypothetical protein
MGCSEIRWFHRGAAAAIAVLGILPSGGLVNRPPGSRPIAITNVGLIDGTDAGLVPGVTVVIRQDRIAAVGPSDRVAVPTDARIVPGDGKYLIPGLWDLHVHPDDPEVDPLHPRDRDKARLLPLFVALGVTSVRDMGGDLRLLTGWRRRIARGELLGPRIFTGGPLVDGPRPMWPRSVSVTDSASAHRAIDSLVRGGADFIKVYSLLSRDAYFALAREARARGIAFAGHVPDQVTVTESSDSGQRSQEHLLNVLRETGDQAGARQAADSAGARGLARYVQINERLLATYDSARAATLYRRLARNGTWQTPTLINWYTNAFGEPDSLTRVRLPLMPDYLRRWWDPAINVHLQEQTPEFVALRKRLFAVDLTIVRQMAREGVGFLAGTDQGGNPYCYPGFSLHDELALFVGAGFSPLAALQTATLNPARFLGVSDSLGSIGVGKIADLVLLDANPLADIRHTSRIAAVFVRGRLLDSAARARIFAQARSAARRSGG